MDSVTEKYSVFDFFNLIIGGAIYLLGLGICNYSQAIELCTDIATQIGGSDFLLIVGVVLFIGCSLVLGTVINEIAHWYFEEHRHWEKDKIGNCLNFGGVIENTLKLRIFRRKAKEYFHISNLSANENFEDTQCSAFFAYCVYYLHVRNQDRKTEKLRETQGLAGLLACVFAMVIVSSLFIVALQLLMFKCITLNIIPALITYLICVVFAVAFSKRYKRATENRIRMVLAVYDACTDMEED